MWPAQRRCSAALSRQCFIHTLARIRIERVLQRGRRREGKRPVNVQRAAAEKFAFAKKRRRQGTPVARGFSRISPQSAPADLRGEGGRETKSKRVGMRRLIPNRRLVNARRFPAQGRGANCATSRLSARSGRPKVWHGCHCLAIKSARLCAPPPAALFSSQRETRAFRESLDTSRRIGALRGCRAAELSLLEETR